MREWSENSTIPHRYIPVCSDKSTGLGWNNYVNWIFQLMLKTIKPFVDKQISHGGPFEKVEIEDF